MDIQVPCIFFDAANLLQPMPDNGEIIYDSGKYIVKTVMGGSNPDIS